MPGDVRAGKRDVQKNFPPALAPIWRPARYSFNERLFVAISSKYMALLTALRQNTRDQHQRLDIAVGEITTAEGYARFLTMHAGVLPGAEAWLMTQPAFATLPDHRGRLRVDALKHDLAAMSLAMPQEYFPEGPERAELSVAGICYVLEGSRLGAAFLRARLASSGLQVPLAFLSHGEAARYWQSFLKWLDVQEASPRAINLAVGSAQALFGAYLDALHHR